MRNIFKHSKKNFRRCVEKLIFYSLKKLGIEKNINKKTKKVLQILFSHLSNGFLPMGYKFDFSFPVCKSIDFFSFTFNSRNENRKMFDEKVKKIFSYFTFKRDFLIQKLLSQFSENLLTFGMKIKKQKQIPILKLEFELSHNNSNDLKKIFEVFNKFFPRNSKFQKIINSTPPDAFCISFNNHCICGFKFYFKFNNLKQLDHFLRIYFKKNELTKFFEKFSQENLFYILALRLSKSFEIYSQKIYLIFETKEFFEKNKNLIISQRWKETEKKGTEVVHFVGGEPTLHTQFFKILRYTKKLRYNIFIITNGIKFAEKKFAQATLPFIDELMVSIHGPNEKIHTLCTRNPLAFKNLIKGLKNIKKYFKGRLQATTCLTKFNYRHIKEIIELIEQFKIKEYQIMSIVPTGEGEKNYYEINPTLTQIKKFILHAIKICEKKKIKIRFSGIPFCILGPKYYIYSYDLWENFKIPQESSSQGPIRLWREPGEKPDFKIDLGRVKPLKCKKCSFYEICGGIYEKYFQKYGDKELVPM